MVTKILLRFVELQRNRLARIHHIVDMGNPETVSTHRSTLVSIYECLQAIIRVCTSTSYRNHADCDTVLATVVDVFNEWAGPHHAQKFNDIAKITMMCKLDEHWIMDSVEPSEADIVKLCGPNPEGQERDVELVRRIGDTRIYPENHETRIHFKDRNLIHYEALKWSPHFKDPEYDPPEVLDLAGALAKANIPIGSIFECYLTASYCPRYTEDSMTILQGLAHKLGNNMVVYNRHASLEEAQRARRKSGKHRPLLVERLEGASFINDAFSLGGVTTTGFFIAKLERADHPAWVSVMMPVGGARLESTLHVRVYENTSAFVNSVMGRYLLSMYPNPPAFPEHTVIPDLDSWDHKYEYAYKSNTRMRNLLMIAKRLGQRKPPEKAMCMLIKSGNICEGYHPDHIRQLLECNVNVFMSTFHFNVMPEDIMTNPRFHMMCTSSNPEDVLFGLTEASVRAGELPTITDAIQGKPMDILFGYTSSAEFSHASGDMRVAPTVIDESIPSLDNDGDTLSRTLITSFGRPGNNIDDGYFRFEIC